MSVYLSVTCVCYVKLPVKVHISTSVVRLLILDFWRTTSVQNSNDVTPNPKRLLNIDADLWSPTITLLYLGNYCRIGNVNCGMLSVELHIMLEYTIF